MPQIPDRRALGPIRVAGSAAPAQINPNVAYDIGRAGAAMNAAFQDIAGGFSVLAGKRREMEDRTWLAEAKIATLEADDAIRRETELNAGDDGTGFEAAPARLKASIEEIRKRPGGTDRSREDYNLWAAERAYETGSWSANTAQKRLQASTLDRLDRRVDTLSGLATSNPERAEEYLGAYEEEVNGYVGTAITATDARERINAARSTIGKASIISRAIKSPGDFGKALKVIEGADVSPGSTEAASDVSASTISMLKREEGYTGKAKWDYRQHSIGYGTKAKSAGETITRSEAERRLRTEAGKVSDYIDRNVTVPLTRQQRDALISFGYNLGTDDIGKLLPDINAGDFDRVAKRMLSFNKAGGETNAGLVARREREAAMMLGDGGAVDTAKLPKIAGTIQPNEILKLSPRDRDAVIRELRPHLQVEMEDRMKDAVASLAAKGSQSVITPGEIDDVAPLVGAKVAKKWKDALVDAKSIFDVTAEAKSMTMAERYQHLSSLVPTGNPEDLAADERKRFDIWRGVISTIEKRLKDDPLGYVSTENESGRQAMKIIAGADPGEAGQVARERAYDTLIRLQNREGVPPNKVQLLSRAQAARAVTSLQEAKTGPAASGVMNALRQTYGKHFDRIFVELVDAGAPQSYLALRTATRAGQDALVESYAVERSMSEGKDTRKDLLRERTGAKKSELTQEVTNRITEFLGALENKSASLPLIEGYRVATERVALNYMLKGKSLSDAVDTAADELFNKRLQVFKGTVIPTEVWEQHGSEISRTMRQDIGRMIAPYDGLIVSRARESGLYTPGHEQRRYVDSVKTHPRFATNEDSTGLYVLDENGDYVVVETPDGYTPIMFTWDQLANAPRPTGYDRFPGAN